MLSDTTGRGLASSPGYLMTLSAVNKSGPLQVLQLDFRTSDGSFLQ